MPVAVSEVLPPYLELSIGHSVNSGFSAGIGSFRRPIHNTCTSKDKTETIWTLAMVLLVLSWCPRWMTWRDSLSHSITQWNFPQSFLKSKSLMGDFWSPQGLIIEGEGNHVHVSVTKVWRGITPICPRRVRVVQSQILKAVGVRSQSTYP